VPGRHSESKILAQLQRNLVGYAKFFIFRQVFPVGGILDIDKIPGRLDVEFELDSGVVIQKIFSGLVIKILYVIGADSDVGDIDVSAPAGINDSVMLKQESII
jgi:hypothetical protein